MTLNEMLDDPISRGLTAATPRRNLLKGAGGMALGALGLGGAAAASAQDATPAARSATPMATGTGKRPNIVMIMSDDVGWG